MLHCKKWLPCGLLPKPKVPNRREKGIVCVARNTSSVSAPTDEYASVLQVTNTDNYLFSRSGETSISDMTLSKILRDHKIPSDTPGRTATPHGFRSSFRDWVSENGYTRDLPERALSHTIPNAPEAAYHRTDLLEARMPLMEAWERFAKSKTN